MEMEILDSVVRGLVLVFLPAAAGVTPPLFGVVDGLNDGRRIAWHWQRAWGWMRIQYIQ